MLYLQHKLRAGRVGEVDRAGLRAGDGQHAVEDDAQKRAGVEALADFSGDGVQRLQV
ncbi:MAG: hypothetical protein M5R40_30040 [Anaerolineae bacterium]|nr:hypothetical protein [Anaerolineae bacterium]